MSVPSPADPSRRGFQAGLTLVELIIAIVIVAVGVAGILLTYNVAVRGSPNPMMAKQAFAIAEGLMEEVQSASFTFCDPDDANATTAASPAGCSSLPENMGPEAGDVRPYDNVNDYDGLSLPTITDVSGAAVPGLVGYSASITVAVTALNDIPAATGNALRITVTVRVPSGDTYSLEGYRARYAPN